MPDNAALAPLRIFLCGPDPEILVVPAELLHPGVKHNEIVEQFEETGLVADLRQTPVEKVLRPAVLFPGQVVLLRRLDRARGRLTNFGSVLMAARAPDWKSWMGAGESS